MPEKSPEYILVIESEDKRNYVYLHRIYFQSTSLESNIPKIELSVTGHKALSYKFSKQEYDFIMNGIFKDKFEYFMDYVYLLFETSPNEELKVYWISRA
jgi:hypothetical protein